MTKATNPNTHAPASTGISTSRTVGIKLYATLKTHTPKAAEAYPIGDNISIKMLLDEIGLSRDMARLVFVNGRRVSRDAILNNGDRIGIFPPVGGG